MWRSQRRACPVKNAQGNTPQKSCSYEIVNLEPLRLKKSRSTCAGWSDCTAKSPGSAAAFIADVCGALSR